MDRPPPDEPLRSGRRGTVADPDGTDEAGLRGGAVPEHDPAGRGDRRDAGPAGAWAAAEGALAANLEGAARLLGRLEARLDAGAPLRRLRVKAAADLLRAAGHLVPPEKLALHLVDGDPRGRREAFALGRWIVRRLETPLVLDDAGAVRAWLGRRAPAGAPDPTVAAVAGLAPPEASARALKAWLGLARELEARSRLARSAALAGAWARTPAFGPDRALVACLLGARILDPGGRVGAALAAPAAALLSFAGRDKPAYEPAHGAAPRLAAWLGGIRGAAEGVLLELAALEAWRNRAAAAGLRGRTSGRLVSTLHDEVAVSAAMAAALGGVSRDAAERGLVRLEALGLAREITGGARWRFWTARV